MAQRTVLIIDDESLIRQTTSLLLNHFQMRTICASNGPEGIAMAKNASPDIILLDLFMPVMDGWSVLAELKKDAKVSYIPVILLTGNSYSIPTEIAFKKGVAAVCNKPFEPEKLTTLIEKVCSNTGLS